MNFVLTLDKIVEKLSRSKRVVPITFALAFLEQSFSPILPEAYIALVLAYRKDISWKFLSVVSTCGSTLGSLITYMMGYFFYATYGDRIAALFGWGEVFDKAKALFGDNVFVAQFLASLTPLPDRIFSFIAGAFEVNLFLVLLATFLGRILRAWFVSYLAYEWGDEARHFIKKHTQLTVAGLIVLLALYFLYKVIA